MGKVSATGGFRLFIGVAASTTIMAVGTIVLARLMLPEEYGLYSIALFPSLMIGLFRSWGVNSAVTKYVAHSRAENSQDDIHDIIVAGLAFEIIVGIALLLLSLFSTSFIASTILHRPESTHLIYIASITIFSGSILSVSQSTFIGFERMGLNSLTMICQAIVKSTVSPFLVLFGYGALGAVLGYTFSLLAASTIAFLMLSIVILKKLRKARTRQPRLVQTLKKMLHYGVPLSISSIMAGFMVQFYSLMMASFSTDAMIGNYQVSSQFTVLLTFVTAPIVTVLFPAFAKISSQNDHSLRESIFASAVKYSALLLVPATMAIMVLSKPMISTLYGDKWIHAPFFLSLLVISNLFIVFGALIYGSFLSGLGETKMLMKLSLLTLSFGLPLAFILIPTLGIVGVILGLLLAGLPSTFWGLYWTWKHYGAKADLKSSAKIFAASAIAATSTYLCLIFFNTAEWIRLIVGATVFLSIYIFTAPLIGAVSKSDTNNLRTMLSGLGVISKLVNIPLTLMEKVANSRE